MTDSEVYLKQPKGYEDGTYNVCELIKVLYGLKECPTACYECLNEFLIINGFKRTNIESCLYNLINGKDTIYLLIVNK